MAKVNYISTSTIQLTENHPTRIQLSAWDLQFLFIPPIQVGLFYIKPKSSQTIINDLKVSLSRTLEFFPHLVGRLGIEDGGDGETSSFHIDCNNAGALFAHAEAHLTICDMLEPIYVPSIFPNFFLMNGIYCHESISQPFLAVQVTELVDGLFIGCTMNHSISDGIAFWHFFKCWSEISRGFNNNLSNPPIIRRWFPSDTQFPIRIPKSSFNFGNKLSYPPLEERVFHFSIENIAALKARANAMMSITTISSLQALLANLWRGVVRSRGTAFDQEVKFIVPINLRPKLVPSLPENYSGSGIICDTVTTTAGKLLSHNLGWAALEMNKVVAQWTDSKIRSFLKSWSENPCFFIPCIQNNDMITNNSPHFNFFSIDFGWGKPLTARGAHKTDGAIVLYRGVEEGSIDISVSLLPKDLYSLGNDEEFMESVSIQDMKLLVAKHTARGSSL